MNEYLTEAFVLDKKEMGDGDMILTLYTQKLGKVKVRATSIRKITSKLSGHFEPLTFVLARIVEKKGLRLVDGLSTIKVKTHDALKMAHVINSIAAENQPDPVPWHFLKSILLSGNNENARSHKIILKSFGIEPQNEQCQICKQKEYEHFLVPDSAFACSQCILDLNLPEDDVLLVKSYAS